MHNTISRTKISSTTKGGKFVFCWSISSRVFLKGNALDFACLFFTVFVYVCWWQGLQFTSEIKMELKFIVEEKFHLYYKKLKWFKHRWNAVALLLSAFSYTCVTLRYVILICKCFRYRLTQLNVIIKRHKTPLSGKFLPHFNSMYNGWPVLSSLFFSRAIFPSGTFPAVFLR